MAPRRLQGGDGPRGSRHARSGNIRHMNRSTRSWERVVAGVGLSLLALDGAAAAADLPLKAPAFKAVYDWTGFYLGCHFGYGGGSFGPGTNPLPEQGVVFPHSIPGLIGGY